MLQSEPVKVIWSSLSIGRRSQKVDCARVKTGAALVELPRQTHKHQRTRPDKTHQNSRSWYTWTVFYTKLPKATTHQANRSESLWVVLVNAFSACRPSILAFFSWKSSHAQNHFRGLQPTCDGLHLIASLLLVASCY